MGNMLATRTTISLYSVVCFIVPWKKDVLIDMSVDVLVVCWPHLLKPHIQHFLHDTVYICGVGGGYTLSLSLATSTVYLVNT